jgi:hypothetical protein
MPEGFTVAVCVLPEVHSALEVMFSFVPSGRVAIAVIWTEDVRPTVHGNGVTAMAEMLDEELVLLLQPTASATIASAKMTFMTSHRAKAMSRGARSQSSEKTGP